MTPHPNIAQFGVSSVPNQFYGQVFPSNQNNAFYGNAQQMQIPQQGLFGNSQQVQNPNQQGLFGNNGNGVNGRQ